MKNIWLVGVITFCVLACVTVVAFTVNDAFGTTNPIDARANERYVLTCDGDFPLLPDAGLLVATATVDGHGKVITSGTVEDPMLGQISSGDAYVSTHGSIAVLNGRWVSADGMVYTCVHSVDLDAQASELV